MLELVGDGAVVVVVVLAIQKLLHSIPRPICIMDRLLLLLLVVAGNNNNWRITIVVGLKLQQRPQSVKREQHH